MCIRVGATNGFLKLEDLVRELRDGVDLVVSEILGDLGHGRDHGRGTAKQDLDVGSRRRHMLLDHVSVNKSNAAGPALGSVVQNVVNLELRVLL